MTIYRSLIILTGLCVFSFHSVAQTLGDPNEIVYGMSVQSSSRRVAVLEGKSNVKVWNYESLESIKAWSEGDRPCSLEWMPGQLTIGFKSGIVKLYDDVTFEITKSIQISDRPLTHIKFLKDNLLSISDQSGSIFIINTTLPESKAELFTSIKQEVTDIDYTPQLDALIISNRNGEISIYPLKGTNKISNINVHESIFDIQYINESQELAVALSGGKTMNLRVSSNGLEPIGGKRKANIQGGWITCIYKSSDMFALGSLRKIKLFTKGVTYVHETGAVVNFIYIISDPLPKIKVLFGTQGKGLRMIDAYQMKTVSK